jgi:hypothetical protein
MDKIIPFLIGLLAALAGWFVWKLFNRDGTPGAADITAVQKREAVKNEIETTPASDLVDAASDADKLRADAAGIAGRARQRLRDRIRKIISGMDGAGDTGGGGK